jgi:hypothetical protein
MDFDCRNIYGYATPQLYLLPEIARIEVQLAHLYLNSERRIVLLQSWNVGKTLYRISSQSNELGKSPGRLVCRPMLFRGGKTLSGDTRNQ